MRLPLLSLVSLVSTGRVAAQGPVSSVFRARIDDVASVVGWSDLARRTGTADEREVRVYTGFGMALPNVVVRLRWDATGHQGEVGYFWRALNARMPKGGRDYDADARRLMDSAFACVRHRNAVDTRTCWPREEGTSAVWSTLVAALEAAGIDSLTAPRAPTQGRDGWSVVIEYRAPSGYTAVTAWMPSATDPDPAVRRIAEIARLVSAAVDQERARLRKPET